MQLQKQSQECQWWHQWQISERGDISDTYKLVVDMAMVVIAAVEASAASVKGLAVVAIR